MERHPTFPMRLLLIIAMMSCATAARATSLDDILRTIDVPAGTQLDVALFSAEGVCASSRQPRPSHDRGALFHSASISKLLTATVILQLRDEGRLALTDRVGTHVPEFAASPIRIADLLTHTSGLRDRIRARGRATRADVDEYITGLARQKLANEPGARWAYADSGYNLLGRVIERVTDRDFATVMHERVLAPLGMSASSFLSSQDAAIDRVVAMDANGRPRAHPWDRAFAPSSGLQSDATDLARFGAAVLAIAAARPDAPLLSPDTLREMTTVRVATEWNGVSQGYGWQLSQDGADKVWRHAGGEAGFESLLSIYPDRGFGLVVMGNRKGWPRFELASALAAAVREGRLTCGAAPAPGAGRSAR